METVAVKIKDQIRFSDQVESNTYDKYIVAFSGGKDSTACFLHLLDIGIPKEKIELWHHDVDGHEETFMDWECTPAYCRAFAAAFGVPIYFSWKQGGFKREMLRKDSKTAPISFECPGGIVKTIGGKRGYASTRLKFPQLTADLSRRWCSAYLKIDVYKAAIANQKRFNGIRTVVISGERGQESTARSKYNEKEKDATDNRYQGYYLKRVQRKYKGVTREVTTRITIGRSHRHVDRWRPVLGWTVEQVWEIIERYRIRVHPCYYLGFSRCSCKFCIFGCKNQFASAYLLSPKIGEEMIAYEQQFGVTMKRNMALRMLIASGKPFDSITTELAIIALSYSYDLQIILSENETWELPAGAYGESCGPN